MSAISCPAAELIARATRRKALLATVESCTGGLIAHRLTDVPGSSAAFWGSWIAYDERAKQALGVPPELLEAHGAVSSEVAAAMALAGLAAVREGTAATSPQSLVRVVSTTGIAGPAGGTDLKPVGLCFIGLATEKGEIRTLEVRAPQKLERPAMKEFFTDQALALILGSL